MRTWIAASALTLATMAAPVAAQDPSPEQAGQEAPSVEAVLATGVEEMMPVGEAQEFPADVERVYLWTRVTGAADSSIQHVWIHDDMEWPVTLQIGGSPWRTWSSKVIPPEWSGEWRVEIRDEAGNLLDTRSFVVGT